jgi:hypothetical protein
MMTDKGIFSARQAVTASGTTDSTNVLDTEVASSNQGAGTPIWLVCQISTAFTVCTGCTSATLSATLEDCATSGGTYGILATGYAYSIAECVKGLNLQTIPLPAKHKRYLKVVYTNAIGSGYIAGNVNAVLAGSAPRTS